MRICTSSALAAALSITSANALNILMNNDDGFGSGNIRELYKMLKADGHTGICIYFDSPSTQP